ncbi:MAG: hypothetical protein ACHQQP_02630 [Gemmatimonadales bacterium]
MDRSNPFRRTIANFDRVQSCETVQLVVRQFGDIAGNGENEQRSWRSYGDRRVANRIVPVAFWIDRKGCIDTDRNYVLVLITRFQRRQEHRRTTSKRRISLHAGFRSSNTLMVADIRYVESGG